MIYSWNTPFDTILENHPNNTEDWGFDIPELSTEEIVRLIDRCLIKQAKPATFLLSSALDQKNLSAETASTALQYMKPLYFTLLSCIAGLARSEAISTKDLIWIASFFGEKGDAYLPCLRTLSKRAAEDKTARKFLYKERARVRDPETKRWLKSVLAIHNQ